MTNVKINYNPYTVETKIVINGKSIENKSSPLMYVSNKRLQEWIEPRNSWSGIFKALRSSVGDSEIEIEFIGTPSDFDDLCYARDKFGNCFENINLIHKNKDIANNTNPYEKMQILKKLYQELQKGPVEEFKTDDIKRDFEAAVNSDFRIVVVAPMSSGKSTLINSIIGKDLLPAVNQATTAVNTEIKDNDSFDDFVVNADDKYGNNIVKNQRATKEVISNLNFMKDPNDPKGKEALIDLVKIEGPVPNLPSDVLNTIFIDTPGGNNSQNIEHEEKMDEAINDENKSLILYVFNGAQLGTNDSNVILRKISNSMKNSVNGKQSRDRFLFVANRMDEFDVAKEPYEDVINNTILPQLASNGITEPALFLASAQTAKLIRMVNNGEKLTEKEEEDIETLIKRFNRPTRILTQFAALNSADKEKLLNESAECSRIAKESENVKEIEKNKYRAAEINSGIPAIEMAIKEYLEKYAIAIKIKTVHDTFMQKVNERNMIDKCQAEWAQSQEKYDEILNELHTKQEEFEKNTKLGEFKAKVADIKLDTMPIEKQQAEIVTKIRQLSDGIKDKVKREEAAEILSEFKDKIVNIKEEASIALDNAVNNGIRNSCYEIISQYESYIRQLDEDGAFDIGTFNIKQVEKFKNLNISHVDDLLNDKQYNFTEYIKIGSHKVKKRGIIGFFQRIFNIDAGWEKVDDYEEQQFINFKKLMMDQLTPLQDGFDTEMECIINDTKGKVESLKNLTMEKLESIDKLISDSMAELEKTLADRDSLQKQVEENAEKAKWVEEFVKQVDDLLTVYKEDNYV